MQFEKWFNVDLKKPSHLVSDICFPAFVGDENSARIGIHLFSDKEPTPATGIIKGYVILPNGMMLPPFDGNKRSNDVWIDIPALALEMQGRIQVAIRTIGTSETTVLFAATTIVRRVDADTIIDPDDVVPSWDDVLTKITQMEAAIEDCEAATEAAGNVVVIQDEEPEEETTKVWIPETSAQEVEVPTMSDLQDMAQNVAVFQDEEPESENTKFWIPTTSAQEVQVPTYSEFQDLRDYMHHLEGKTLVCLGDSITYLGYADAIATATGMTVHNCGFSSARMAKTSAASGFYYIVNYFGFFQLAASIASNDWTIPDQLNSESGFEDQKAQLAALKEIDFSGVDFVTVAYGTNDFGSGIPLDDEENPQNFTTYKGAIRYGVTQLLTAFPHLKILGVTPPYQFWQTGGVFTADCDTYVVDGHLKADYVRATMEGFEDMKLPYVDNFFAGGINYPNHLSYFTTTDGTHPDQRGRAHLGRRIASAILLNY